MYFDLILIAYKFDSHFSNLRKFPTLMVWKTTTKQTGKQALISNFLFKIIIIFRRKYRCHGACVEVRGQFFLSILKWILRIEPTGIRLV